MPLSDHEQRMLDQIESALYAEDPKFASSVRGGGFRAPTARRRLQGAALFIIGLGMLVSGVAFKETMIGSFPILSVFRFCRDVRWCGVCHHRSSVVRQDGSWRIGCWGFAPASYQGGRGLIHQPYGRSVPAPLRRVSRTQPAAAGQPSAVPLFVWASSFGNRSLGKPQPGRHRLSAILSPV